MASQDSQPTSSAPPCFPFSALQGQQELQTALLLCAIDPMIGGLLIEGPRGTAKTTSARALADLLSAGKFVNLPLSASEEQLVGSLNLEAVLEDGSIAFKPGLLARAHTGVLYVDEVNLLADHLVDTLLDVCASGINYVERDGISHQHPAQFVLIGTMNPEEGELRPQLLDRFGLYITLNHNPQPALRQQIVRQRLAFDANPKDFITRYAGQQQALQQQLQQAQQLLPMLTYSDENYQQVSDICYQAGVEGVRADLTLLRAARAHAALQHATIIRPVDIEQVQYWVLGHRSQQQQQQPSSNPTPEEQPQTQAPDVNQHNTQPQSGNNNPPGDTQNNNQATDTAEDDWGALPPPSQELQSIKTLRPLTTKKP